MDLVVRGKDFMSNQFRQGDVFLVRCSALPIGATLSRLTGEDIVLAHGEATGHAHRIASASASMYEWNGDRLIEVKCATGLIHEEHATLEIPPGFYKVVIQREYSPNALLNIAD